MLLYMLLYMLAYQSEPWRKAKGVTFAAAAAALTGIATAAAGTQLLALVPSRRASAAPAKKQQAAEEATTAPAFSSRPPAPATQGAAEYIGPEATAGDSRREQSRVSSAEHASAGIGSSAVTLAPAVSVSDAAVGGPPQAKKAAADKLVEEAEVY
jgi:hypothetical protein